jgi:hypothetical protein
MFYSNAFDRLGGYYLKQTGMISPLARQYFSTSSGAILAV